MRYFIKAWRFLWGAWGFTRHILAARGLLQWAGKWESVTAAITALALAAWSAVQKLPAPVTVLIGLSSFAVVSVVWRVWKGPRLPLPVMVVGRASNANFDVSVAPEAPLKQPLSNKQPESLFEAVRDAMLQTSQSSIPAEVRPHELGGIVVAIRQIIDSDKALAARIVVEDIRKIQDGKFITSRLFHSDAGRFRFHNAELARFRSGENESLHYDIEGVWWLVYPPNATSEKPTVRMFWSDRTDRPTIALPPGNYVAALRIWVGENNVPLQAAWAIDSEQRATISAIDHT